MKGLKYFRRALYVVLSLSVACSMLPTISYAAGAGKSDTEIRTVQEESNVEAVDGTTGAPLGGFGAGAVKFNAMKGSFAAVVLPPVDWKDYEAAGKSRFQFYSNVGGSVKTADALTAVLNDGRYDDDAVWPVHTANFGETNGIQINLEGFSPLDNENYDNMSMPYAFYEVTLKNNNAEAADASIALLWDLSCLKNTNTSAKYVDSKGFKSDRWAVYAAADGAEITAGSDNGFMTSGKCNNSPSAAETRTAVKVQLEANETKKIKFVLAWYNNDDTENAYYLSKHTNAAEIAQLGLDNFDKLQDNAEGLVSRMRGSDIPAWYVNQCLNSLANISNNTMYKKDGRVAFSEGMWTCFGTMDQMWHARPIMNNLIPELAWTELEYWARTQRNDGQIHHDFNYMTDTSVKYKLVPWDDTEHDDYRNIDKWVDLNCGFIISVYEAYKQTGNEEKLGYFWDYIKKAGQRIFDQVELYGDKDYPYTFKDSSNSYDAGGDPNPFNASISAVAYKIMTILCDKMGETELKAKYQTAYDTVVKSYSDRYIKNGFKTEVISESFFAGQWLAMHLKLGQIWTEEETEEVIASLDDYYHPYYKLLGYPEGTYTEWTPYMLAHYGGLLLHTQRQNQYEALQKDAYTRQYKNRNQVFNQQLGILPSVTVANYAATNISGKQQYISTPTIWRNYYDVIGYQRNAATKELWLEPILLPEMNHQMTNAAYVSPEGYGTISCTETATEGSKAYQNKNITFKPENNTYVSKLYLTDNFSDDVDDVSVTIDGKNYDFTREGEGYTKELVVEYNGTVTSEGINIVTSGNPGKEPPADPERPDDIELPPVAAELSAYTDIQAEKTSASGGLDTGEDANGINYIKDCDDQDYAQYNYVGFDDGAGAIVLKLRSSKQSQIELVLGSIGSSPIQTLNIPDTNGEWQDVKFELDEVISGTNNVIFQFRSGSGSCGLDIDSFTFEYKYRLLPKNWTVSASKKNNDAVKAIDGDTTTRWDTGGAQKGDEWFQIDLGEMSEFNRIVLDSTELSKNDYPRQYEVYVSENGKNFEKMVALGKGTSIKTNITFERQRAQYIKITQLGTTETNYWSLYELAIFNDKEDYEDGTLPDDKTINKYTYTGTVSSYAQDTKYFDIEKYKLGESGAMIHGNRKDEYFFADNVSEDVRKLFSDKHDKSKISSTYTCCMVDYIGCSGKYDNKPAITDIELPSGEYKLYFIGSANEPQRPIEVAFENDTDDSVIVSNGDSYTFSSSNKGLTMNEFTITLSKAYKGDITFYNSKGWLPDLYAVKLEYTGETSVTKTTYETSSDGYNFSIVPRQQLSDEHVIIAVYDKDGKLISANSTILNGKPVWNISLPVLDEVDYAKVFVWKDNMQPIGGAEKITLGQ